MPKQRPGGAAPAPRPNEDGYFAPAPGEQSAGPGMADPPGPNSAGTGAGAGAGAAGPSPLAAYGQAQLVPPPPRTQNIPPISTVMDPVTIEVEHADIVTTPDYPQSSYNYGTWTPEDDRNLLTARARGHHWADLQRKHFPTKTANACRKRYERLVERRGVYDYDARRFERIAKEYMGMRKQIWSGLAARVGEKWPVVEAQCMSAGLRNIQSSSRSHTNRWRREAKLSQKAARTAEEEGIPLPPNASAPVTTMGLISPVEDEFGAGPLRSPAGDGAGSRMGGGPRNSAEMMPPPLLPGSSMIPPIQPAPQFAAPQSRAGRGLAPADINPVPSPVEPGWEHGHRGGFLGQLDDAGWRDDDYEFDDTNVGYPPR